MSLTGKKYRLLIPFLILCFITGCKKEDQEKIRRENYINLLLEDIKSDSLKSDVEWLQNNGTRFALAENRRNVAVRIRNRFIRMGYADARLDSFYLVKVYKNVTYEQWQYNVIATLHGTVNPDSLCVIGGHYDNILVSGDPFTDGRGANDNASGTAGVLEIARVMKKNGFEPESSVRFVAFGAEELGLYGSRDFASDPDGAIRYMLNFDMIAYEPDAAGTSWTVNIMDYDNSHGLEKEAEELCTKYTLLKYYTDNTNNTRSDSYSFYSNGYKALFFFSQKIDPGYHTMNDISSNCNFNYCREIVRLACALTVNKN